MNRGETYLIGSFFLQYVSREAFRIGLSDGDAHPYCLFLSFRVRWKECFYLTEWLSSLWLVKASQQFLEEHGNQIYQGIRIYIFLSFNWSECIAAGLVAVSSSETIV